MFEFSPQSKRRMANFKANRRGWWSLWIFVVLLLICLCGELIANDRPLIVSYQGNLYYPTLHPYVETDFGGELPFEPDYASAQPHRDQGRLDALGADTVQLRHHQL
jgi:microcin C transport system permease protein